MEGNASDLSNQIEALRTILNEKSKNISNENKVNKSEILNISQELDKLITEFISISSEECLEK